MATIDIANEMRGINPVIIYKRRMVPLPKVLGSLACPYSKILVKEFLVDGFAFDSYIRNRAAVLIK